MTWGSFATRGIYLVTVLPLLLTRLSAGEISLWYLFLTIAGLQMLVDIGFSPTFSRIIAFAMGGAEVKELRAPTNSSSGNPNWTTMERVCRTMRFIYKRLTLIWILFLSLTGTIVVIRPIGLVADQASAWIAWGIVLLGGAATMWGNLYGSYLQGINQVALLRRWEMVFSIAGIVTNIAVLLAGGRILSLILTSQGWQILTILRNKWFAESVENGRFKLFGRTENDLEVFAAVWPGAWRSGIGILMSYGLVQASGILYAQLAPATLAASYFLALRLIQTISQFSQAPFYSKLPSMARFYAEGKKFELLKLARNGMTFSYWSFVFGFLALSIAGPRLLKFIGSNADFPSPLLWGILGSAYIIERFGAMHLQLYSLTNNIVWHIANGMTGLIFIASSLIVYPYIQVYAFPFALLIGNLLFYAVYSSIHSYREYQMNFIQFELATSFKPFFILILYLIINIILRWA